MTKKKLINTVLKFNVLLFPFLTVITYILLFVEVYKYKGFFYKHFYISTDLLLVLVFLSGFFTMVKNLNRFIWKISSLLLPFLLIAYLYLVAVGVINYPNYVFSKYHIQPQLLLRVLVLDVYLVLLNLVGKIYQDLYKEKAKPGFLKRLLPFGTTILILVFLVQNLITAWGLMVPPMIVSAKHIYSNTIAKRNFRMKQRYGYLYDYLKLIKKITPNSAKILLPPQKNPWQLEGNQRLVRYFLYPRELYSAHEEVEISEIDYVMIAWGSESFPPENENDFGWPKSKIESQKVYIFDLNNQEAMVNLGNYNPELYLKEQVYGLIKLK